MKNLPITNVIGTERRLPEEIKPYADKLKSHIGDLQEKIAEMEICVMNSPIRKVTEKQLLALHMQLDLTVKQYTELLLTHEQIVVVVKQDQDQ